jgi:hypothetical protein
MEFHHTAGGLEGREQFGGDKGLGHWDFLGGANTNAPATCANGSEEPIGEVPGRIAYRYPQSSERDSDSELRVRKIPHKSLERRRKKNIVQL